MQRVAGFAFKVSGAVAVSYLLFILIPVLHALFGGAALPEQRDLHNRRVVAQILKKKK